jgi:hypothetical protein
MIEKIKLDDEIYRNLSMTDENFNHVYKMFKDTCNFFSEKTTKKIIKTIMEEYEKSVRKRPLNDDYLYSIILSALRQSTDDKQEDLLRFESRAHSIIGGCMPDNSHELIATVAIQRLDENVNTYTGNKEEKQSNKQLITTIVQKISNHIAIQNSISPDYRNENQANFEGFIATKVREEVDNFQNEIDDYYYGAVYNNVQQITHNVIEYIDSKVKEQNPIEKQSIEESENAKALK